MATPTINHWIFQSTPERYNLTDNLQVGKQEIWQIKTFHKQIQPGDVVWFWQSGRKRGIYGWGYVDNSFENAIPKDEYRVPVRTENVYNSHLDFKTIVADEVLNRLSIARAAQGACFKVTMDQGLALIDLASDMGKTPPAPTVYRAPSTELEPYIAAKLALPQIEARYFYSSPHGPTLKPRVYQINDLLFHIIKTANTHKTKGKMVSWWSETIGINRLDSLVGLQNGLDLDEFTDDGLSSNKFWEEVTIPKPKSPASKIAFHSQSLAKVLEKAQALESTLREKCPESEKSELRMVSLLSTILFGSQPAVQRLFVYFNISISDIRTRFLDQVQAVFNTATRAALLPTIHSSSLEHVLVAHEPDLAHGKDALDIKADYKALASLMASRTLQPPLSIGLFGHWGMGKSFFMNKLRDEIEELAASTRLPDPENAEKKIEDTASAYYPNIVQIEFNSWHYVDSDLWASLVVHIFNNLRMDKNDDDEILLKRRENILLKITGSEQLKKSTEEMIVTLTGKKTTQQQKVDGLKQDRQERSCRQVRHPGE